MRWMLDTDTCIHVMKHHPPQVQARLRRVAIGELGISAIVLAELRFGIQKSQRREDNAALIIVPASRGTGRLESKASALDRQAKAEALDSKRAALAGTMIKADNAAALADFLAYCLVLDWPHEASGVYAEIRNALESRGTPIGSNDLLIAAHARHLGCTLVTNNVEKFTVTP